MSSTRSARSTGTAFGCSLAMFVGGCLAPVDNKSPDLAKPSPPSSDGGVAPTPDLSTPFEPSPPSVYVAKVKQLLVGEPPTDAEVTAIVADPTTLGALVDKWTAQPEFEGRMTDFFRNAFQQNNITPDDVWAAEGEGADFIGTQKYQNLLARGMMDSFALTAWSTVAAGKPFNDLVRTDTYMLTTAQMVLMAYIDEMVVDDAGTLTSEIVARNPLGSVAIVFDPTSTNTVAQSLAAGTSTYMVWPDRNVANATCQPVKQTFTAATNKYFNMFHRLFGDANCPDNATTPPSFPGHSVQPLLTDADYTDWHPVQIVAATATDTTSPVFYDILSMRTATSMTLRTPRVGFAGTLAFHGNWPTNASNEARVTANQALIVSIGRSIDGANETVSFPVNSSDADHASDPACQGCHSQLDPFKQYFRQSWTLGYHLQEDTTQTTQPAGFSIDGVSTSAGFGLPTVTDILATHPRFALAWTLKLYFWATSRVADETDPEVLRIANAFTVSGYDFKTLVRELFSSPITTYAAVTQTTAAGGEISIARRDQLCAALSNRLALPDVCGQTAPVPTAMQAAVTGAAALVATDTYYRAFELPALPTQPDLFFRASTELVCGLVAAQVVSSDGVSGRYKTSDTTSAITDMVTTLAGLAPSDVRSAAVSTILTNHLAAALATSGVTPVQALRSTVQLACQAPSSVIVGL